MIRFRIVYVCSLRRYRYRMSFRGTWNGLLIGNVAMNPFYDGLCGCDWLKDRWNMLGFMVMPFICDIASKSGASATNDE